MIWKRRSNFRHDVHLDATLISVVGATDFLEAMNNAIKDPIWAGPTIMVTGYVFAGLSSVRSLEWRLLGIIGEIL